MVFAVWPAMVLFFGGSAVWSAVSGPQNLTGWLFLITLPLMAATVAKGIAWRINRRVMR